MEKGPTTAQHVGQIPALGLYDIMRGLSQRQWTGAVRVDTGFCTKVLFFGNGELVFASSNLIDDRLGEVIYREGLISIDELTESAAKVTRERRFGQVLISSGTFDNLDLWQALSLQVLCILRSLFALETVAVELQPSIKASTELAFGRSTLVCLEESLRFGLLVQAFARQLFSHTQISLRGNPRRSDLPAAGTYFGDFLNLLAKPTALEELLQVSKVQQGSTLAALLCLSAKGLCSVGPLKANSSLGVSLWRQAVEERVTRYDTLLGEVPNPPIDQLRRLTEKLNANQLPCLFLNNDGAIDELSLRLIHDLSAVDQGTALHFLSLLDCLIGFVALQT